MEQTKDSRFGKPLLGACRIDSYEICTVPLVGADRTKKVRPGTFEHLLMLLRLIKLRKPHPTLKP